jgi:hypothetical protein
MRRRIIWAFCDAEKCRSDCLVDLTSDRVHNKPTGATFVFQVSLDTDILGSKRLR